MIRHFITFVLIAGFLVLPARADAQQEETGAYLVRDINTHTSTYNKLFDMMPAGPFSYFFGLGGQDIFGLWKTDGTPAGTSFVKALSTQENTAYGDPSGVMGDYLFFGATDPTETTEPHGIELWKTNGTLQGTTRVADLIPGARSSMPRSFAEMGGKLYFVGGSALWRLDGPDALPVHVWGEIDDANPTINVFYSQLFVFGDHLFFSNYQAETGNELWISDGTLEGTHILVDLNPGAASSNPNPFLAFNGQLYFSADNGIIGSELWAYEAVTGNVHLVADINPSGGSSPGMLQPMKDILYFQAYEPGKGSELYQLDKGTVTQFMDLNPGPDSSSPRPVETLSTPAGERMLFFARGPDQVNGLYVTDGTEAGTHRILDNEPVQGSPSGNETVKTSPLAFAPSPSFFSGFFQGNYYFINYTAEYGDEVWSTDGTVAGTKILKDIWPGKTSSDPYNFGLCGSRLCLVADDGDHGFELWSTTGSQAGTALVADLNSDPPGSFPSELTAAGSLVYFLANDSTNDQRLWRTDGTSAGTIPLLQAQSSGVGLFSTMVPVGERVFFLYMNDTYGSELWSSNGWPETTGIVADINPGPQSSNPMLLAASSNLLFFTAYDQLHGRELWKTDGTQAGTKLVADLTPGPASTDIRTIQSFRGRMVFTLTRNAVIKNATLENELWSTDGTASGTKFIANIDPPYSHEPFVEANGLLFFTTENTSRGSIWQSDGTGPGTMPVPAPACLGSYGMVHSLAAMNGALYFINTNSYPTSYPEIPVTLARTRELILA